MSDEHNGADIDQAQPPKKILHVIVNALMKIRVPAHEIRRIALVVNDDICFFCRDRLSEAIQKHSISTECAEELLKIFSRHFL